MSVPRPGLASLKPAFPRRCILAAAALALVASPAPAETLERVISREDPRFNAAARLAAGRDGNLYLSSNVHDDACVLRVSPDGTKRLGGGVVYALGGAVANAEGTIATANGHFSHSINFYDPQFRKLNGSFGEFRHGDDVGWDAPSSVAAGAGGDFYALDQHARRIVRLRPSGQLAQVFTIPVDVKSPPVDLRVCEPLEAFFVLSRDHSVSRLGFDGKVAWSKNIGPIFDVADDGGVVFLQGGMIKRLSPAGEPVGKDVPLAPAPGGVQAIAVIPAGLAVRRPVIDELFRIHDLDTGELKQSIPSLHERVAAKFPGLVWTAGEGVGFALSSSKGPLRWRVWMTPFGDTDWREIPLREGRLAVPADFAGLYQLRAAPTLTPQTPSEYTIKAVIEVRSPAAVGTASVWTPFNRVWWAKGEAISFSADLRTAGDVPPRQATVALRPAAAEPADAPALWSSEITLSKAAVAQATVPADITAGLAPGRYTLRIDLPGHTCVAQPVRIGPGPTAPAPFRVTLHGDYGGFASTASAWDCADEAEARLASSRALGVNQYVSRTFAGRYPLTFTNDGNGAGLIASLRERLKADAAGVSPSKADLGFPQGRVLAALGSHGIHEWVLPIGMDAILPMGERESYGGLIDPAVVAQEITTYTAALRGFPGFVGWDWVANWWAKRDKAFTSPEEKTAYDAALAKANETGAWSDVLTTVGERRLSWQIEAQASFKAALAATGANLRTASAGPYRRPEVYPPTSFADVDEVDLHFQAEQISCPNWTAHAADFYSRPGKPAWIHPELWNDTGTGEQILPMSWLAIMRGAHGIGCSGQPKYWGNQPRDPRSGYDGILSIFRAIDDFARTRGPWLATLDNADRVAIPVSRRHIELDDWGGIGGRYFTRLWEAHQVCLAARRPATFVFAEDEPDLSRFKAVLLIGLRYEPEPAFVEMVGRAEKLGARLFADGTCRESLVKAPAPLGAAAPLGHSCDHVEHTHPFNNDAAWWQIAPILAGGAGKVAAAIGAAVPAVADCDQPQVLVGERRSGAGRFVWVVNNTRSRLAPGHLWRVQTGIATCEPVVARVGLPVAADEVVYDLFAMREVEGTPAAARDGKQRLEFDADLRFSHARLYAVLPGRIGGIEVVPSGSIEPGAAFEWQAMVKGASQGTRPNEPPPKLPIELRLLDGDGTVLEELFTTTGSGRMRAPRNAKPPLVLAARELVSGQNTKNMPARDVARPPAGRFGPRIKDLAVSLDGGSALLAAFDWGENLYAIDTATGKVRWTGDVGDYFAFAPVAFGGDFACTSYDLESGEGYHLHVLSPEGMGRQRFAFPGLPARLTQWAFPLLQDRLGSSAVAPDGSWVVGTGNLAVAAWKPDGTLLWSDDWSRKTRTTPLVLAAGSRMLVSARGMQLSGLDPLTGKAAWQTSLGPKGSIQSLAASSDGTTVAAITDADGGAVHLVRGGRILASIPGRAAEAALAPDGSWVAIAGDSVVRVHTADGSPSWSVGAGSIARLRPAADGRRLAVVDDLGTLRVFDVKDGRREYARDLGGLAAIGWLPNGDLLAATWLGTAYRLAADGTERWRVELAGTKAPPKRFADVATSRLESWKNALPEPLPMSSNLLAGGVTITAMLGDRSVGGPLAKPLVEGDGSPPSGPLLSWEDIGMIDSGWKGSCSLVIDTFRRQLRVDAVTIVEDPAHPESWMRDARLEYWDPAKAAWIFAQYLTSDAPIHSHSLAKPVEAARFRLTRPDAAGWPASNLRISKIVFHGKQLGSSHPDVVAGHPVITLFDEDRTAIDCLKNGHNPQFDFQTGKGSSGAVFAVLKAAGLAGAPFDSGFGHTMPNWAFTVVENPRQPGQVRWLEFAWKPLTPQTRGISLRLAGSHYGGVTFFAGEASPFEGASAVKRADAPPADWKVERIDLWSLCKDAKDPFWIANIGLGAVGGGAAFDQIRLAKTEQDLLDRQETKGLDPNP